LRYAKVHLEALGYELAPNVITSSAIDDRLAPLYKALGLGARQVEALTGIRERRFWNEGQTMSAGALAAARKVLASSRVSPSEIGMLIYAGVCRDNLEPATACAVADGLDVRGACEVLDLSNACLGVVNGIVHVANAIELGQIKAGLVVSCESARQIVDMTIDRLLARADIETFKTSLATMTGGSGAAAVLLAHESIASSSHKLLGGAIHSASEHHRLCRWGPDTGMPSSAAHVMETHAIDVLENGVRLGARTWRDFLRELEWSDGPAKVVCHQVGQANRDAILKTLSIPVERDFSTYPFLGNIGTVSLPMTAAIAGERRFLDNGDRVGLLGIGSGLNCVMLGVSW